MTIRKHIPCKQADFKYALGDCFIGTLETLHKPGLKRSDPIEIHEIRVVPRAVKWERLGPLTKPAYLMLLPQS